MKKTIIIIGAGPAGLTAAYELLNNSKEYNVIILEESNYIGGLSRTVVHNDNYMDIGGHRFFSKNKKVIEWWEKFLPKQGKPSCDDIELNRIFDNSKGSNPEKDNLVMLIRRRLSRIYYNKKFFDYPIKINMKNIKKLGIQNFILIFLSYIKTKIFKLPENCLENFYINNFGKKLYSIFFEGYTEKLWGIKPKHISADWGIQRTKKLSINEIIKNNIKKLIPFIKADSHISLIEEFYYPKYGAGQLWETVASEIEKMGGKIFLNCKVTKLHLEKEIINKVTYCNNLIEHSINADIIISSMPLKDLIIAIKNTPLKINQIAQNLPYRDFVIVGVLVKKLKLKNETNIKTINNIIPDCWFYIQDKDIKLGRIQIFNNWSPYIVKDYKNTIWLGLEYFCNEHDEFWEMNENEWVNYAISELIKIGILSDKNILDFHVEKVQKAYPGYWGSYKNINELVLYLNSFENLYCIGRNGQHKYNNLDHSMCTAFETVNNILYNVKNKNNIWNVNVEKEYQEIKSKNS
ncbi:NAD(P)/FAD-dependent oxidoreductase [bacterium]|nr:NAD(P)/FAD-dependent oxidoreductase [bacterium]